MTFTDNDGSIDTTGMLCTYIYKGNGYVGTS